MTLSYHVLLLWLWMFIHLLEVWDKEMLKKIKNAFWDIYPVITRNNSKFVSLLFEVFCVLGKKQ